MPRVGVTTRAVRSTARAGRRPAFQAGGAITALDRPTGLHFHSKLPALRRPIAGTRSEVGEATDARTVAAAPFTLAATQCGG